MLILLRSFVLLFINTFDQEIHLIPMTKQDLTMIKILYPIMLVAILASCRSNEDVAEKSIYDSAFYKEIYRPQVHFSPKAKWMNDPNGMVYYKGAYHLFYQHFPGAMVWGPMHWGHAVSSDLVHWTHLPIALYPDSLGLVFSGSAVVDETNSSGLGTQESPPLVAMFTYHSVEKEKAGRNDYQTQGIAYSIDDGQTWIKYEGNPVIKNPGAKDFRDPKVIWHEPTKKWVVVLAVKDHTEFWGSTDLKKWSKLSDFGFDYGAHGGVWECPDLIELNDGGEKKWVLIVSLNPGGPNGGSGTQYFVGDFDGTNFKADTEKEVTSWLDYGPDNYAGVTWSNAPNNRKIFMGWMSNWAYAEKVPTSPWRSATTSPRDLSLINIDGRYFVKLAIVPEFTASGLNSKEFNSINVKDSLLINDSGDLSKSIISATLEAKDFSIVLSNNVGYKVIIGYDEKANRFYINRGGSGDVAFSSAFSLKNFAARISKSNQITFQLITDVSSVEVFFDDGLSNMTSMFFSQKPLDKITIKSREGILIDKVEIKALKSIWQ
jgi:fructan beta-fructosidase